jgi:hypothetical protein
MYGSTLSCIRNRNGQLLELRGHLLTAVSGRVFHVRPAASLPLKYRFHIFPVPRRSRIERNKCGKNQNCVSYSVT